MSLRRWEVQHTSAADWYAREVARLQDEVALLIRLLGAIHVLGQEPAATHGHRRETATPPRTASLKHAPRDAR